MKKKVILAALAGLVLAAASVGGWFYYQQLVSHSRLEEIKKSNEYKYHYVMITEEQESDFWKSVYQAAGEEAKSDHAYVEFAGSGMGGTYTMRDYMKIAIASKVDGIIIQGGGQEDLTESISEANQKKIPVVTVLEDVDKSPRQSFVGVNGYQLGRQYGQAVCENLPKDAKKVLVLMNGDMNDVGKNLVFSQIKSMVHEKTAAAGDVEVEPSFVDNKNSFDAEEYFRKVFLEEQLPDVIVCLDSVDTQCAYQAMVDYNQVGRVVVIGYNPTENLLEGISRGIMPAAFETDARQLGTYSVQALAEYQEMGHVSEYFSVDLNQITSQNVDQYLDKREQESTK